jgi:biotin carboxyl carrier protein
VRRYTLEVKGRSYVVDVDELASDRFKVFLAGDQFEVRLSAAEDLAEAEITPEIVPHHASPRPASPAPATPPPVIRPPAPETLPKLRPAAPPPLPGRPLLPEDGFRAELQAPMPGTVLSVEVAAGQAVQHGQVLVKLEAMKMVNALRAPQDGVIAEVKVRAGESVGFGQALVTFRQP